MPTFEELFKKATGGLEPYPYQARFATAESLPHLLNVPTGAGKTATAILGWLWRRTAERDRTPRRLVYCLPMRVLVEQAYREAERWLENLGCKKEVGLHVLMGGEDREKWFLEPERSAVLIGTQDMLLSRALNRGYGESRFQWPIDFGLLNNDALWVFDEPQLMANGMTTSAQLAGLRMALDGIGPCNSVWMSATLEPDWLNTVDLAGKFRNQPFELDEKDFDPQRALYKRMTAAKTLRSLGAASTTDMKAVAKKVWEAHQAGTQTIVVLNTIERAKATYKALRDLRKKSESPRLLLIHSRFRPRERERLNVQLKQNEVGDRIVVATQVVEAGVDVSSRTLITELAPWASFVQRAGRCNRTGDDGPGQVIWIEIEDKNSAPYEPDSLNFTREQLEKLDGNDVSPQSLDEFKRREGISLGFVHKHVLRRRDLLGLFDTSPDLSGNDIDIARFVRSDDLDSDVQVFWREWQGDTPQAEEPKPDREELCSAPIRSVEELLKRLADKKSDAGYLWDHLDSRWIKVDPKQLRPGMAILLPVTAGGYSDLGWDAASTAIVSSLRPAETTPEEGASDDPKSTLDLPRELSIADHTQNVCTELAGLLKELPPLGELGDQLMRAARWHDVGKAHNAFQEALKKVNPGLKSDMLWAKSGKQGRLVYGDNRKYFRHELASALAGMQQDLPFEVLYLVAAHHGKVRLNIRSLPGEFPPDDGTMFALGVHHGDELQEVELGGETCPKTTLDLSTMRLGGEESWTGRSLALLARLGPFKLAYLESLLRIADVRASLKEASHE